MLDSGLSGLGSSRGQGHSVCWVLGQDTYFHSASLHPGVKMPVGTDEFNAVGNSAMD